MLATLNQKARVVHQWDAQTELLLDNELELSQDMESATEFQHNASIAIARLEALINNYKRQGQAVSNNQGSSSGVLSSKLKLPKLQLPTFTGSYTEWTSFFDLFKAAVDSNTQLTNCEKLNYLKACVKGDAAKLISSFSITDYNYGIAMTMLRDRYENERSIVNAHLKALWSQQVLKS